MRHLVEPLLDHPEALRPHQAAEGRAVAAVGVGDPDLGPRRDMALDRSRIVDVIWHGQGTPATGPVVSNNPNFYNKALKPYVYDQRAANRLLDAAAYKRGTHGGRSLAQDAPTDKQVPIRCRKVRVGSHSPARSAGGLAALQ